MITSHVFPRAVPVIDMRLEILSEIFEGSLIRSVRTHRWKYSVRKTEGGNNRGTSWEFKEEFLYDLKADPYELNNLVGFESHRKVSDIMKERLIRRMQQAGEDKPAIINAKPIKSRQKSLSDEEMYD